MVPRRLFIFVILINNGVYFTEHWLVFISYDFFIILNILNLREFEVFENISLDMIRRRWGMSAGECREHMVIVRQDNVEMVWR